MATTNSVLANDTAITLDWADVTSANLYHVQVATQADMGGALLVDDNALVSSTKSYTDAGADGTKRWWRFRSSSDAGVTWSTWSEVGSFWIDTTFSADVALTQGNWALINPALVTDKFVFDDYPVYQVTPTSIYRVKARNRLGELLSEYLTSKAMIKMNFPETLFITHQQMREILRFHVSIKTFYLAVWKDDNASGMFNVWKVQFTDDPSLSMLVAGREDFFTGDLTCEEV